MIHELRMYTLKPGTENKVLNASGTVAREIRDTGSYGTLIGHWSSVSGLMHQYVHMWEYPDAQTMRDMRAELSAKKDWQNKFIPLVAPHILSQKIRLLRKLTDIKKIKNTGNLFEIRFIRLKVGLWKPWSQKFLNIESTIFNKIKLVGMWITEFSDPNELVLLFAHKNSNSILETWDVIDKHSTEWSKFIAFQENSVLEEKVTILKPSIYSPLQ